jgi:hypothetical protein
MTPEEKDRYERIDRVLEFLANNQAQLSVELHKLKEITGMHTAQIQAQGKQIEEQGKQIGAQGKQIGELGNLMLRLGHIVEEQASAQTRTDERLNALIATVERYLSNGRK